MKDKAKADQLLQEIGTALVDDRAYKDTDWAALALVAQAPDGMVSLSGYAYDATGAAFARSPKNMELFDLVEAFREATEVPGQSGWQACVFRLRRDRMQLQVEFEYNDLRRWDTRRDFQELTRELRPR